MKLKGFVGEHEHDVEVQPTDGGFRVTVDGEEKTVDAATLESFFYSLIVDGRSYEVSVRETEPGLFVVGHGGHRQEVRLIDPRMAAAGAALGASGPAEVRAVMPGRVVALLVSEGDPVAEGQGLIVLEAMKMENEVKAPRPGTVRRLSVAAGQTVQAGAAIALIE